MSKTSIPWSKEEKEIMKDLISSTKFQQLGGDGRRWELVTDRLKKEGYRRTVKGVIHQARRLDKAESQRDETSDEDSEVIIVELIKGPRKSHRRANDATAQSGNRKRTRDMSSDSDDDSSDSNVAGPSLGSGRKHKRKDTSKKTTENKGKLIDTLEKLEKIQAERCKTLEELAKALKK